MTKTSLAVHEDKNRVPYVKVGNKIKQVNFLFKKRGEKKKEDAETIRITLQCISFVLIHVQQFIE